MSKNTSEQCPGCLQPGILEPYGELHLCKACAKMAKMLDGDRQRVKRIESLLAKGLREGVRELPDVLDAVRYRTRDREHNSWYVSISEISGEPVEIFASTAFDRDQHLQSRISNLTTITRLISLILRHISMGEQLTLEKTLTQLHRSSRQPNDLPDMLVRVLSKYCRKPEEIDRQEHVCP